MRRVLGIAAHPENLLPPLLFAMSDCAPIGGTRNLEGMSTSPSTIDSILSGLSDDAGVTARKMFGEYGLFLDGKMVGLVCDDILFVKPTTSGLTYLGDHEEGSPYPGAKPCAIVEERFLLKRGALQELLSKTAAELPAPKPKASPKRKPQAKNN